MSASKEGIACARQIVKYNEKIFGLNIVRRYPSCNDFPFYPSRKVRRYPNTLSGCRVKLLENGMLV